MDREYFTKQEAQEKIGKFIETLVDWARVPKGTTGTVVEMYHAGDDFYGLDIQWHLSSPKPSIQHITIGGEAVTFVQTGRPIVV
jgi:hypothetical protein